MIEMIKNKEEVEQGKLDNEKGSKKAKALRKMRYWKEWREGGGSKDDDVHGSDKVREEPVRKMNNTMEEMKKLQDEVKKRRKDWEEEHIKSQVISKEDRKIEFESEKDEEVVEVPTLEPQGLLRVYRDRKEDVKEENKEGRAAEEEGSKRSNSIGGVEDMEEMKSKEIDEELNIIKDKVMVEVPTLEPKGPDRVYKDIEKEEEAGLGKKRELCMRCVYFPCICGLLDLEQRITQLRRQERKEGNEEVVKGGDEMSRDMVEGGGADKDREERGQEEITASTTPPPQPRTTPTDPADGNRKEEKREKEDLSLIELMRKKQREKEEEEKEKKKEQRKKGTPSRRLGSKKKEEDSRKVVEAPMRKLMESWVGGKKEEKPEKVVGIKGLLAKFSKENEKEQSFEDWKKTRQEQKQRKRKVEEDEVMVEQPKRLKNFSTAKPGKLNFKIINNDFSTCSNVGKGNEIATVGGGEHPGLVSNVTVTDTKNCAGRDNSSTFTDNK